MSSLRFSPTLKTEKQFTMEGYALSFICEEVMKKTDSLRFDSKVIHAGQSPDDWQGATLPPIYQTASHNHPTAESLSATFSGQTTDHIYMRLTNPTNRALEEKLAALEKGRGAIFMSSGMAAISNGCMALLRAGDEFVCGNSLFMSTYLLFKNVFGKYGITPRMVESTDMTGSRGGHQRKNPFCLSGDHRQSEDGYTRSQKGVVHRPSPRVAAHRR